MTDFVQPLLLRVCGIQGHRAASPLTVAGKARFTAFQKLGALVSPYWHKSFWKARLRTLALGLFLVRAGALFTPARDVASLSPLWEFAMRRVRITLSLMALGCALASCNKPAPVPKPSNEQSKPSNADYMRGYQAGRRDERRDLCNKFEQHKAGVAGALGAARIGLIHTFCLMQL